MTTKTDYSTFTQHQKILTLMCQYPNREWWKPQHFMLENQGDLYVGYEASARLSELAKEYPEMIDTRPAGKYKERRLRRETIKEWLPDLPKELRYIFHRTGQTAGLPPTEELKKPEPPKTTYTRYRAAFRGRPSVVHGDLTKGGIYDIALGQLEMGQPLKMLVKIPNVEKPKPLEYRDITAFRQNWKVL